MLRAGSVEISRPDNDVLLLIEQSLLAVEHAEMQKMAELHEARRLDEGEVGDSSVNLWTKTEIEQTAVSLAAVRRAVDWVRRTGNALYWGEGNRGE